MTVALLCGAVDNRLGPAAAASAGGALTAALHAAGAREVRPAVSGPDVAADLRALAATARQMTEPLLICADNLVAHPSLLWTLATEPAGRSTVLVAPADGAGDLREERGRLVAAAGAAATVRFLGAMYIAPGDLPLLAGAADRAAIAYESSVGTHSIGAPGGRVGTGVRPATAAVDALLPALLDAGLVPLATRVRLLHAERVTEDAALDTARDTLAAVDEDAARLRLAVKEKDDFFTTYAVSTWSPVVTRWCARAGLSPSGVTVLSVLLAVGAAGAFWQASRPAMIAGAVLLYLGFVLDCVDGQLARYTRRFSAFGGWLDTMADRAKEYAVYAGLAAGAERAGLPGAWPLAIAAIVLQTVRHMTDTWYGALHDEAAARQTAGTAGHDAAALAAADAPFGSDPRPDRAGAPRGGLGARLSRASNRVQADTGSPAYWAKRIVVFPIGERWALIALLAAVSNGRTALIGVLAAGAFAAAYTLGLRSLRSRSMRVGVLATVDTARHRDDGPLVRSVLARAGLPGPLGFATLAAATALILVAALVSDRVPAAGATLLLAAAAILVLAAGLPAAGRHAGALDWLVPAALRAAEYLVAVAVGLVGEVPPPVVFLLLFALALHHYDLTARMEKGTGEQGARAGLGWDGRVVLLVVAALAGVATAGTALLAGIVAGAFAIGAAVDWRGPRPSAQPSEGGPR